MPNIQGDTGLASQHIAESMELQADGYAHLFSLRMTPPNQSEVLMTFSPKQQVTWQGYTWIQLPCHITDLRKESSGEAVRPKFTLGNPEGAFHQYAMDGWLDGAEVCFYQVLGEHLRANANSFVKRTWRVGKVLNLNKFMTLELREALDGQFFLLPPRAYYPPEFPSVSLT